MSLHTLQGFLDYERGKSTESGKVEFDFDDPQGDMCDREELPARGAAHTGRRCHGGEQQVKGKVGQ